MSKPKVTVGFSGGKDSTASLILLKDQGYAVRALTMTMGLKGEKEKMRKIQNLARLLGVPLTIVDLTKEFRDNVIDYFLDAYVSGLTPNPCLVCNNRIKFKVLMEHARETEGADFFATGHYAHKVLKSGDFFLTEPADKQKSQIYFLSMIGRETLKNVIFPLAHLKIEEVKKMVEGLPLGNLKESQDVCFLQGRNLVAYLKENISPRYFSSGDILDTHGFKIGTHRGAVYFTIGQRRGTHFSSDRKLYVVKRDVSHNTVTLGEEKDLYTDKIEVRNPVFWRTLNTGESLKVKVRYLTPFAEAEITGVKENGITARFKEPVKSVTPGQVGVFYDDHIIVAAGFIV